jgi:hypothetical protein
VDQSPNIRELAKCQGNCINTGFERREREEAEVGKEIGA